MMPFRPEQLFSAANMAAMVAWLVLVLLPRRRWAGTTVVAVAVVFAAAYTAIVGTTFGGAEGGFGSLSDVARLFDNRWMLLAGWLHYLAFDLLIGAWEVHDSQRRGIRHVLVVPCLFLTFMFGPVGWLLYLAIRAARARAGA